MPNNLKVFTLWLPAGFGNRPREDYFVLDKKTKSFVVADGVGLYNGIEYEGDYPRTSGSYRAARVFCKAFIKYFTKHPRDSIRKGFRAGNFAVARVNQGRSKYSVFQKHKNLFAATGAMARIREPVLEWGRIYDAGIAVIGKNGKMKFKKDGYDRDFLYSPRDIKDYEDTTYTFFSRTIARNAVGRNRKLLGYGVITGEREVERYLETGKFNLAQGDTVVLYTDGFTPYIKLHPFRKMLSLVDSQGNFQTAIEHFIKSKNKINLFQHEKSIIVIKV